VGIPAVEAERYATAVKEGATLVTVTVDDARADRAVELLARHHPLGIDERDEGLQTDRLPARDVRRFPAGAQDEDAA
jgi:hypothetical protein